MSEFFPRQYYLFSIIFPSFSHLFCIIFHETRNDAKMLKI